MSDLLSKIISYQYQGQAADLNYGAKGTVVGYNLNYDSNNQSWRIVAVGGNLITIQNATHGTYANPSSEAEGAKVIGGTNAYKWQQVGIPGGWYQIRTTDGKFAWFLTGSKDEDPVVLKGASYTGHDSQWGYEPTPPV